MSARSLRKALKTRSGGSDGPESANSSALVGVCWRLADDRPVRRGGPIALAEVALEALKKICPVAGADDEHIAAIVLVPLAAQIAERSQRVQGASHDWLRDPEHSCEAADRMRSGRQIDQHQQGHLPVGKVGLARTDIGNQGLHPAGKRNLAHSCQTPSRAA